MPQNSMPRAEKTYTLTLFGPDTFQIMEADSVIKLAVASLTAINGSIEMVTPINVGGKPSTAIPVSQSNSVTISPATGNGVLDGIKIAVPAGGALAIICQI